MVRDDRDAVQQHLRGHSMSWGTLKCAQSAMSKARLSHSWLIGRQQQEVLYFAVVLQLFLCVFPLDSMGGGGHFYNPSWLAQRSCSRLCMCVGETVHPRATLVHRWNAVRASYVGLYLPPIETTGSGPVVSELSESMSNGFRHN